MYNILQVYRISCLQVFCFTYILPGVYTTYRCKDLGIRIFEFAGKNLVPNLEKLKMK